MDTFKTRRDIGFPAQKTEWNTAKALYTEHTLRIAGHPVMEDWETGYMHMLADIATTNKGNVLEIGYGLGISARAIQTRSQKHYVIECHPDVITKGISDFSEEVATGKMNILSGFWEDVTPILKDAVFDGILFDSYPLDEEQIHANHFWFFEEAYRLLKPGGILTYYSDEATSFSAAHLEKLHAAGFRPEDIDFKICDVNPPKDCEYWQDKTILAPIVKKA
jgi:guanidinoacetate N-methyltransferase